MRRIKVSQWQNRRREALTKLASKSITSCASHDARLDCDIPMIAICSRNVRNVAGIIVDNIIQYTYLKNVGDESYQTLDKEAWMEMEIVMSEKYGKNWKDMFR